MHPLHTTIETRNSKPHLGIEVPLYNEHMDDKKADGLNER